MFRAFVTREEQEPLCRPAIQPARSRTYVEAAELSALQVSTIASLESGAPGHPGALEAVGRALQAAGIEFLPDEGSGPAVRLKRRHARNEGLRPDQLTCENDG